MSGDIKLLLWFLLLSSSTTPCFGSELDVQCLRTIQQSVDHNGVLEATWNFTVYVDGFICEFSGVDCWNPSENRVLALRLSNLGLGGQFPRGLENCNSMITLDLSRNKFSGPIPTDIARLLPGLTFLDLSYNSFSGEIPVGITNIVYMNVLNLKHNKLRGPIPGQIERWTRLSSFSVADNLLSGQIPSVLQNFPLSNFTGNLELCGKPLDSCESPSNDDPIIGIVGAVVGFIVGFVVSFYFPHCFVCSSKLQPYVFRIC